jgi:hypothetical protein
MSTRLSDQTPLNGIITSDMFAELEKDVGRVTLNNSAPTAPTDNDATATQRRNPIRLASTSSIQSYSARPRSSTESGRLPPKLSMPSSTESISSQGRKRKAKKTPTAGYTPHRYNLRERRKLRGAQVPPPIQTKETLVISTWTSGPAAKPPTPPAGLVKRKKFGVYTTHAR